MIKPKIMDAPQELRKFGFTIASALLFFSVISIWKNHWFVVFALWVIAGINFIIPAIFFPSTLRPVYLYWMKFALILGWVNSRIILTLLYYLIFTPVSIVQKIIRRDALECKFPNYTKDTYWHSRAEEQYNPKHFERQY